MEAFDLLMEQQKETARRARTASEGDGWKKSEADSIPSDIQTEFLGYEKDESVAKVIYMVRSGKKVNQLEEGDRGIVVLEQSPFYGEGGGQVGDIGSMSSDSLESLVKDTKKSSNGLIIHSVEILKGVVSEGDRVKVKIDLARRKDIMKNHSATHLLHKALKKVLGTHVSQAGSYVDDKRLRFDFSHFEAMTAEQLLQVEKLVNEAIFEALPVKYEYMPINDAKALGAAAQFDEKYGDIVRVVSMGDFSIELCGGTHVGNTSDIQMFKIISESSVASGVRRIEAISGRNVLQYLYEKELKIDRIADILKSNRNSVEMRADQLIKELKQCKKEIEKMKMDQSAQEMTKAVEGAEEINGVRVIIDSPEDMPLDALRNMAQGIIDKYLNAVVLLGSISEEKIGYVCAAGADAVSKGVHAGNIVKAVAAITGGGGGGKPTFAQAGGKDPERLEESLKAAKSIISEMIG